MAHLLLTIKKKKARGRQFHHFLFERKKIFKCSLKAVKKKSR